MKGASFRPPPLSPALPPSYATPRHPTAASGATCAAVSLKKARVDPPAAGSLYCGGIPGILNSNLTVKSATSLDYSR